MTATIRLKTEQLTKYMALTGIDTATLARTTGLARSSVNRVMRGVHAPGERFIAGVLTAFPALDFDDLFTVDDGETVSA